MSRILNTCLNRQSISDGGGGVPYNVNSIEMSCCLVMIHLILFSLGALAFFTIEANQAIMICFSF